jgi:hypothetical protein
LPLYCFAWGQLLDPSSEFATHSSRRTCT